METNKLQELINKKAQSKLEKDLSELHLFINRHPLFKRIEQKKIPNLFLRSRKTEGHVTEVDPQWLLSGDHSFRQDLLEYWLPIYIERETQDFLNQVQSLSSQVSDLMAGNLPADDY